MNKEKTLTTEALLEKLEAELKQYEHEWLQMTPRELINQSYYIVSVLTAKNYIGFMAEDGNVDLVAFDQTENILEDFMYFYMDQLDEGINEETIRSFESFLLEDY